MTREDFDTKTTSLPKADPPRADSAVTRTHPFAAQVRADPFGKNKLILKSTTYYQHQLNKFKDGEHVTFEIHNKKPKRTDQQNRYYWGAYLPLIAQEAGEPDMDALHELFKGKFLSSGIVEVLGFKTRKKKSTTDLSAAEFCEFITKIEDLTGIMAPPTENWDLAPLHQ